jgi:hypothetical protein
MDTVALLGSTLGLGLVAGFRLYATVLAVGLGVRFGLITLHPSLSHLQVLSNTYILSAAGLAYLLEFFADKIPWVDSIWDSVHTLIRPLGAAFLGATAVGSVDPVTKWTVAILCGGVALTGHSAKASARLVVNHSPEPFSNIGLSLMEDLLAIFGVWLSLQHPVFMLGVVLAFLAVFLWLFPKIFRLMRVHSTAIAALLRKHLLGRQAAAHIPARYAYYLEKKHPDEQIAFAVRCVAGKGVKRLRNSVGYFCFAGNRPVFVTRRLFRFREYPFDLEKLRDVQYKKKLLVERLVVTTGLRHANFDFFKDSPGEPVVNWLESSRPAPRPGSCAAPLSRP